MARPAILGTILIDIFKRHHLLSVSELLTLLPLEEGKKYNKTSVYRALEKLEEQGVICQHTFASGETKYELRQAHHDHLVCGHCGRVLAANCDVTIASSIDGFQTDHYHLTVFGLCADCQENKSE
jgi:Fe2+ or Zn2+ uptake regulation protein